jgi:hypothetical protein
MSKQKSYKRYARKSVRKPKTWNKLTRHHDKARSLGGTYAPDNIFMLSVEHHRAYHRLFGLRTFAESARVLMRMEELHHDSLYARSEDLPGETRH